ncbi:MAG: PKD domain-containing protein [Rhodothermales bacterium]
MNRFSTIILGFLIAAFMVVGTDAMAQEGPTVVQSSRHHSSIPLREMRVPDASLSGRVPFAIPNKFTKFGTPRTNASDQSAGFLDPVLQTQAGPLAPTLGVSFDGSNDDDNSALLGFRIVPPDTDGDVGPNHYVQWINLVSEIFDKNGNTIMGPFAGNLYFQGLGGDCEANNDGDPVVLYDESADRWLVSQFAVTASPYSMCIAISQTADPTGAYNQYEFNFGTDFPDYPKLGIWGDSYTMTTRDFANGASFAGQSAVVMDRDAMLNGQPATMVRFANAFGLSADGRLAGDSDAPISGPVIFGGHGDDGNSTFELWELNVDWNNPGAATLNSIAGVSVPAFDGVTPNATQPSPGETLAALPFFTMHRLNVRDFGTHLSMVSNHTVEVSPGVLGVRWYEFRKTTGNWTLYQSGTYSPDSDDRWMGSIAINAAGDIALGYSRSGSSMFPSIYMTGQTADQSGTGVMNVAETLLHAGGGVQTGSSSRWGDYSMMSVDPSDNNSFWFTTEYYAATGSFDFNTRIASFNLGGGGTGNINPVASFTSSCTLLSCDFTDTSSDADGSVVSWSWTFGDGGTSTAQNPSHAYGANGTYTVGLTVTDDQGATGTTSKTVTVNDGTTTGTMHVETIVTAVVKSGGAPVGQATVTIFDENESPVANATVNGTFSGDLSGSSSAVTNSSGVAVIQLGGAVNRNSVVNFCVDTVAGSLTYDPAQNESAAFACGEPPPPGDFMHVHDLVTTVTRDANRNRVGQATITVYDENEVPVANATVAGTFSGDLVATGSAVTDANGVAIIQAGTGLSKNAVVNFCVDDVTGALTYDAGQNENAAWDCAGAAPAAKSIAIGKDVLNLQSDLPVDFDLAQNYPNPFNPTTIIAYAVPEASDVTVKVFNMLGQEVATLATGHHEAGRYQVSFNASNLSAGIYLYTIKAGSVAITKRMTLLK